LVALEGYTLAPGVPARPGDTLELDLYWRAERPIPDSYTVFNHVEQPGGGIVAQEDGLPLCGQRETTEWDPGELIVDRYRLPIRSDAPPGDYALLTGMYQAEGNYRLDVLGPDGAVLANAVQLTTITVAAQ
ncbi:MAG TPA: hypothetical protein VER55_14050, partial [Ardenticatenaceae bacterium]|nr:hypothetical protein [Ardenticatenaceae bacterium]